MGRDQKGPDVWKGANVLGKVGVGEEQQEKLIHKEKKTRGYQGPETLSFMIGIWSLCTVIIRFVCQFDTT